MSRVSDERALHLAIIGIGGVGSELMKQIEGVSRYPINIVAVSNSLRMHLSTDDTAPLNPSQWTGALDDGGPWQPASLDRLLDALADLARGKPGRIVLVDSVSGSLDLYKRIVGPAKGVFYNEATVGAGLPIISTLKDLVNTGDKVRKIEGVFSGTLSYIFNEYSKGEAGGPLFSSIVQIAKENGYTEPHPGEDLSGADVARKLTILSRMIPDLLDLLPNGYGDVNITSLVPQDLQNANAQDFMQGLPRFDADIAAQRDEAAKRGNVLRYVGVIDVEQRKVEAKLQEYHKTHAFATSLQGSDNIIMFHTERYGARPLLVQGAGAGNAVTAMGVMSDILKLY